MSRVKELESRYAEWREEAERLRKQNAALVAALKAILEKKGAKWHPCDSVAVQARAALAAAEKQ